ncbi:carbohydrate ABC transporter permease [Paenibacillus qinlingensis]|uniref:Aldouronate transport system permease protein n=1 Tax=Paenibacillus qinlingensis TaxID=1837343 RepID=A0ABU1NSJ6_9BACL|nr:carbohydrate ABC transporter permease [Paenibacillus qinlingensis]MDR6550452.1 putative aldouronate transport system permease protein [Paenibacillus qinlingensis]
MISAVKKRRLRLNNWIPHSVFTLLAISCVIPMLLVVIISVSDSKSIVERGYSLFPSLWSSAAYQFIFQSPKLILNSYGTTLFVTVVGTVVGLLLTAMISYSLSRKEYKLAGIIGFLVFFSLLFNAGLIPSYIVYTKFYLLKDTFWILILPGLVSAWNVILLRTFFFDLPQEVLESASIDGCSEMRIFWQIVLPMSKPALATIGLILMLTYWNEWFRSLIYIDTESKFMLQYLLYKILLNAEIMMKDSQMGLSIGGTEFPSDSARMAIAVIAAGPMMFVFPFFQKYFVRGITAGAVKG